MALIHDIVASASNVGYNKFILLVAHGADSSILPVVHKLGMEGYFCIASTWYDFLRDNKHILEDFMWHADEAESSMGLSPVSRADASGAGHRWRRHASDGR